MLRNNSANKKIDLWYLLLLQKIGLTQRRAALQLTGVPVSAASVCGGFEFEQNVRQIS